MGAGTLVLLGTLIVVNASASTRDHGKRMLEKRTPEKPISRCLTGNVCIDDVLRIDVDGDAALSGRYRVDSRGGIDYPFVGRLTVSGLNTSAVAKLIADGLKEVRRSPPKISVEIETDQKAAK
jgi:hypothetical protein